MSDKIDELKAFFKSLQQLEGMEEADLQEMGDFLGADESVEVLPAKPKDPSFQLMSDFMNSLRGFGNLDEAELNEILNYSQDESEKIPEKLLKETEEEVSTDIRVLISKMKLPQKVKMGMFGNAACRAVLITNGNRLVQMSVLKNPKLQDKEVTDFAKNTNMSKAVLRTIGDNRQWMSAYEMKITLVSNPKTPLDVATKWLRYINVSDLKKIARSKNIPGAIVTQAKKRLESAEKKS